MRPLKQVEKQELSIQVDQYKHLVLDSITPSMTTGALTYQALIHLLMFKDKMTILTMMIFGI